MKFAGIAFAIALAFYAGQSFAQEDGKPASQAVGAGGELFKKRCAPCHSLADGRNGNGPSLFGIIDRKAADLSSFKYSRALRQMAADDSLIWSEENLTRFLARPSLLVPGTRMAFPGVKKEEDLANLIAWIKANSGPPSSEP
ncbi:MAG: c-type cytochrome [Proteobacteria bacterium]|nr:c-type cytochrome [Pseudomonadota bacterium]